MSYNEFCERAIRYHADHPEQRFGQALFNALYEVRPDLADEIRSGPLDPFYTNNVRPLCDFLVDRL